MASVDERIARLELNNQQFEQAANQTIATLGQLDKSLELKNADSGFKGLQQTADRFNLSAIQDSLENISSHFTRFGMVVDGIFMDIVNKAEATGKKIADFLTITPVKSGFQEYETQINAIQTILANTKSKGSTLEDVNRILDDLNHYADKTIYNFTQMTKNIGTFTAAGVGLEDAATAIKGIANLAAVSGSTSEQASRAMYQLSQALAAGRVNLQDWNSVVNAGMGGQIFQDALKRTAKAMGQCVDESKSFRESISSRSGDSWLTSEVLLETLKQFSGDVTEASLAAQGFTQDQIKDILELGKTAEDAATVVKTFTQLLDTTKEALQSGWTQTWELIIGDFEEAKELLTYVSNIFNNRISDMSDARNNLLEAALGAEAAGLEQWHLVARNALDNEDLQKAIGEAAGYVDESYAKMIAQMGGFENAMKKGVFTSNDLEKALFGAVGAVDEGTESYKELESVAEKVLNGAFGTGEARVKALTDAGYDYAAVQAVVNKKLLGTETSIENLSDAQIESLGLTDEQTEAFKKLVSVCRETGKPLSEIYTQMTAPTGRDLLVDSFKNSLLTLGQVIYVVKAAWAAVFPKTTADQIYNTLQRLKEFTEGLKLTGPEAQKIQKVFIGLFSIVKMGVDVIKEIARGFSTLFEATVPLQQGFGDIVVRLAEFITSLANSGIVTEIFASAVDKVVGWILTAKDSIIQLYETIREKIEWPSFDGFSLTFEGIVNALTNIKDRIHGIFKSILGETEGDSEVAAHRISSLKDIFELLSDTVKMVIPKITGLMAKFWSKFTELLSNVDTSSIFNTITGILELGILNAIREALSGGGGMLKGIKEIVNNIAEVLDTGRDAIEAWQNNIRADTLLKIAAAVGILAVALISISAFVAPDTLGQSLGAVTALLLEVIGALQFLSQIKKDDLKGLSKAAASVILLSLAISILAKALVKLSNIETLSQVINGLIGIGGAMLVLLAGVQSLSEVLGNGTSSKELLKASEAIVVLAIALRIMTSSVLALSELSFDALLKGLIGVGVLLTGIAVFVNKTDFSEMAKSGGSLIALAAGILIMGAAVKMLGALDTDTLVGGLLSVLALLMSMSLAITIISDRDLSGTAGSIIALALAMMLLTVPVKTLGSMDLASLAKGIISVVALMGVVAGALAALEYVGVSAATMLSLSVTLVALSTSLLIIAGAVSILSALPWQSLAANLTIVMIALVAFVGIGALAQSFSVGLLALSAAFAAIGISVLAFGAGLTLIMTTLNALAAMSPATAAAISLAIETILVAFAEAIPKAIAAFLGGIDEILDQLMKVIPKFVAVAEILITSLALAAMRVITVLTPALIETVANLILTLINSITEHVPEFVEAILNLIDTIVDTLTSPETLGKLANTGIKLIKNLASGIVSAFKFVSEAVQKLGPKAIEWIRKTFSDLWDDLLEVGGNILSGIGEGIGNAIDTITQPIQDVGNAIVDAFTGFFIIESPSQLMRDEVGTQITAGIAEGIEQDTSAEEAAKVKAQGIVNAFKEEIDKINNKGEIYDLEYQLWESTHKDEKSANDYERSQKKLENLAYKVRDQIDLVDLATQEYNATLETLGESNEATTEAYKKQLNAQIELSDLYSQLMDEKKNMDTLLGKGKRVVNAKLTKKELDEFEEGGVDAGKAEVSGYQSIGPMGYVEAQKTADQIIEGILSRTEDTKEAAADVMVDTLQVIKDAHPTWNTEGSGLVVDFAAGIAAAEAEAAEKAKKVSTSSVGGLRSAITDGSAYSAGLETAMQYNKGLEDGQDTNREKDDMDWAISDIIGDLFTYDDLHPTITPQYDTGTLDDYAKKAYGVYSKFEDQTNSSLASGISNSYASKRNDAAAQQSAAQQGYKDIVNALGTTNDLISSYANKLDGMQVVMDSGALVGQVSSGVDKSLGNTASMKKRGAK